MSASAPDVNAVLGIWRNMARIAPNGPVHVKRLVEAPQDRDIGLPEIDPDVHQLLFDHIALLPEKIGILERDIRERARQDEAAKRLMTILGIGGSARPTEALAPPPDSFAKGARLRGLARPDGAAKLVVRHNPARRDLENGTARFAPNAGQRLMTVVRWAARKGAPDGSWLGRMLKKSPA
ncbi:hypothetical protein [Methylocystis sp. IM2]|uniref:hypothetical protein n=1 Tax=unclassified Methylocystis TaxID=2625913 RepID=UPI004047A0C0